MTFQSEDGPELGVFVEPVYMLSRSAGASPREVTVQSPLGQPLKPEPTASLGIARLVEQRQQEPRYPMDQVLREVLEKPPKPQTS